MSIQSSSSSELDPCILVRLKARTSPVPSYSHLYGHDVISEHLVILFPHKKILEAIEYWMVANNSTACAALLFLFRHAQFVNLVQICISFEGMILCLLIHADDNPGLE